MKDMHPEKKIIGKNRLEELRSENRNKRIVFCSGCFDVFHAGHAVFINQCAELGDILVVGVGRDITLRKMKGSSRPVNHENNRIYLVANLEAVDYTLFTDELTDNSDVKEILALLRPDVFAVTETDGMAIQAEKGRCISLGIEMVLVKRTVPEGLILSSTTEILTKLAAKETVE